MNRTREAAVATETTIIVRNARVMTMDGDRPFAEAIAIAGDRIIAVGSNDQIDSCRRPGARVIDAKGASALPGFNEAHMHIFAGSVSMTELSLLGVRGMEALKAKITSHATANPQSGLLVARAADYTILSDTARVTRHDLDRIVPDRPFIMTAPDFHTAWANTAALRHAGILHGRDVGVGNEIVMGDDGLASGELREANAMSPVLQLGDTGGRELLGIYTGGEPERVTPLQRACDVEVIRRGLNYCASLGITSVQNMDGNLYQLEILDEIERAQGLPVRMRVPFHMKNSMPMTDLADKAAAWRSRFHSDRLRCDFVKIFMDGVVESGTAVLVDDYADQPGWKGEPLFSPQRFAEIAIEADRLRLQVAVHAIGDGAVRIVLDGYEAAIRANGARDRRNRVEHAEIVHPDDVPRFARLGTIASMQPTHPPGSAGLPLEPYVSRIGEARWPHAFAWKALADAGARLAFATDWPVSQLSPMNCIFEAMTRKPWRRRLPDHRLTLMETLAAYTRAGAWAEFMEDRKGMLKPGYLADVVVLSHDLELTPCGDLKGVHAVTTICDGRITYEA
jgi:predicted amidohydrolase YtcJ